MRIDDAEFDARLTAALYRAAELDYAEQCGSDTAQETPDSPQFRRKTASFLRNPHRYVRNRRRPVRIRILRSAAAVFAIVVVLFGAAVATSPAVRATVSNLTHSWFEDRTIYIVTEPNITDGWTFGYIPDGFELVHEADSEHGIFHVYENGNAEAITVSISAGSAIVDNEHETFYQTVINGHTADIYEDSTGERQNIVVVYNETESVIAIVTSAIGVNELIKIAEGMSR
jgi:hypothetical protein